MKGLWKDALFGILIVVLVVAVEFLVTLPLGAPTGLDAAGLAAYIDQELLLTSLPAGLLTFLFAWILRTGSRAEANRKSIVWTLMVLINYVAVGVLNGDLLPIMTSAGVYILLIFTFAGPKLYAMVRNFDGDRP
jgi:hypothetical protein